MKQGARARSMGEHGFRNLFELMRYEWTDYTDFEEKYGSENNIEATAKRFAVWQDYNLIGLMLRKGLVDADDLFDMGVQRVRSMSQTINHLSRIRLGTLCNYLSTILTEY